MCERPVHNKCLNTEGICYSPPESPIDADRLLAEVNANLNDYRNARSLLGQPWKTNSRNKRKTSHNRH